MKKITQGLLLLLLCHPAAFAQSFNTISNTDELFVYKVKAIDEFIERFDDDKNSFLRNQYEHDHKSYGITHQKLLTTLFNLQDTRWASDPNAKDFVLEVTNAAHPKNIHFTDSSWYAEANCVFMYDKNETVIPLILHISTDKNKGSKWTIAGIGHNTVVNITVPVTLKTYKYETNTKFIPTPSHATDFVDLHNVFNAGMNPIYYFDNSFITSAKGSHFIDMVLKNKIQFQNVKDITFHFFNVDNWVFSVSYFDRDQYNAGWLINNLAKANKKEKEGLRKQLLNL